MNKLKLAERALLAATAAILVLLAISFLPIGDGSKKEMRFQPLIDSGTTFLRKWKAKLLMRRLTGQARL